MHLSVVEFSDIIPVVVCVCIYIYIFKFRILVDSRGEADSEQCRSEEY